MKATTATAPWYSRLSARSLLALLEECNPDASNDRASYGRSLTTLSLTLMFSVCFATSRSSQSVCAERSGC